MKKYLLMSLFALAAGCSTAFSQELVRVGDGYSETSVNATSFRKNSVVTHNGWQYIAYYDKDEYMVLGKRRLGSREWELKRSGFKGRCADAHNVISIMADGDGYLHVSCDHHGNPLNYFRSREPESVELGEKMPMTGVDEDNVTYPEFYRLPDGGLIFVYRSGSSGRGNLVMNRYDLKQRKWETVHSVLIDGEGERNAYWQLCMDARGTMHLSWVWRETYMVETNHDLCYARSKDGGRTWEKSDGGRYDLPINIRNAEYACRIPMKSELINQTDMTADNNGNPMISTYWRDAESDVPQYRIVWHDGSEWHTGQVSQRKTPFTLSGGGTKMIPVARPKIAARSCPEGTEVFYIVRDEEYGAKVSVYRTRALGAGCVWELSALTDFGVGAWEPSYDTELWRQCRKLHIYVQKAGQGDGEKRSGMEAQPVYVLELNE